MKSSLPPPGHLQAGSKVLIPLLSLCPVLLSFVTVLFLTQVKVKTNKAKKWGSRVGTRVK